MSSDGTEIFRKNRFGNGEFAAANKSPAESPGRA